MANGQLHEQADELFDRARELDFTDPGNVRDLICDLAELLKNATFILRDHSARLSQVGNAESCRANGIIPDH